MAVVECMSVVILLLLSPQIHALITGPFDTPYEGGFFLFLFRCPPDYPIHPPRVKLITTGHNTVSRSQTQQDFLQSRCTALTSAFAYFLRYLCFVISAC